MIITLITLCYLVILIHFQEITYSLHNFLKRPFIIWDMRERICNSWHGRNCWLQSLGLRPSRGKKTKNATYKQSAKVELYAFTIVIQTRRKRKLLCSFLNTTPTKFVVSSNFTDTYSINKRKISRSSLYLQMVSYFLSHEK